MPTGYFEALYASEADPWHFESSAYERAKYAHTLAALPRRRFSNALEIGCSIGVLTARLAWRCDRLVALDVAESALESARKRCSTFKTVRFSRSRVPAEWPDGLFDLILLSEVVYYLDADDIASLAERVLASTGPGAVVLMVHWTGATDYPMSGDEASERLIAALRPFVRDVTRERRAHYRLDSLARL